MSGFFFAAGLALWTVLFERAPGAPSPRWRWWVLGSALAAWPLVPWAAEVLAAPGGGHPGWDWRVPLRLEFWPQWFGDVTGLETARSLGRVGFLDWLGTPLWNGHRTFAVGALLLASLAMAAAAVVGAARTLWPRRREWRALAGGASSTGRAQNAAFLGFGILLTVAGVQMYPHYLIVVFPLTYLWLARAALLRPGGRRLLAGIWMAQVLLAALFLLYVHRNGGSPEGDYGVPYARQVVGR